MMKVNVLDKVGILEKLDELRKSKIDHVVNLILDREVKCGVNVAEDSNLNVVLVDEDEIRKLNSEFRGVDHPTDVLSFLYSDEDEFGEVVICPDVVKKNAKEHGSPFVEEFLRVLIHGVLHLLGYDHENEEDERRMFEKQENFLREIVRNFDLYKERMDKEGNSNG